MQQLKVGRIIRHNGVRKVIRRWYRDDNCDFIIEFVDRTISKNHSGIEWDGRK